MNSIKEHADAIKDVVDKWGNIPFAVDSQGDLKALDKRSDAWWEELKARVAELERALFGEL